ncbi:TPA: chemotaxis protein [Streptococcus equi subsp. zooepidemicus]|uniref:chemotaxis protein n=1 Tax=Streptococcus equi TaxID=1336 RepID=UPI001E5B6C3A|nr:chemotaxis protein [Streptococcus equi]MCD3405464.1 chemotaxis protein [Streptococcus equi subsp. zooepidemicus]HEK9991959.1 chemotaxis protein [Streptococcus equi subsp. zooepidemicus]HEL0714099.1 chemotaxis protein [Streptococcus equi subsp. zooepidemicus]HEL1105764.1 chemotaxis protein [Streptococcus equi subsp. zooepidemicus]HEL1308643.1 chemotaxis protein [Streptococcus equi subsp. zooepidemicus]
MTLKTMATIGLTSVLAYQVYRKRHQIKETLVAMKTSKKAIQADVDRIKANLAVIQKEAQTLQAAGTELTYKWQAFSQETQAHLTEIQKRMSKYQQERPEA